MSRVNPKNVTERPSSYRVFRNLASKENGDYSQQIAESLNKTQGTISEHISMMEERNLVKKGKQTRATYYEANYKGIVSLFKEIWSLDSTPDEFQEFLEKYVSAYVNYETSSSIRSMLRDDFAEALLSYERHHDMPDWLEDLRSELGGELEAYRPKEDYIDRALR